MMTRIMNSRESRRMMLGTVAPRVLRMPISLVRTSTVKEAKPKRPRQATMMARLEKTFMMVPMRCSDR